MELWVAIAAAATALATLAAMYQIAAWQGLIGSESILITVSQPTALAKEDLLPPFTKEIRLRGITRATSGYPHALRMPLLVVFGVPPNTNSHLVYLLVTLINKKGRSIQDVTLQIDLPSRLMPDPVMKFGTPDGMSVKRQIDRATGNGNVVYDFELLKPYDNVLVAEPLIFRPSDIVSKATAVQRRSDFVLRFLLRTNRTVTEEKLRVVAFHCTENQQLIDLSTNLTNSIMAAEYSEAKKPLRWKFFRIPAAYKSTLWVRPGFLKAEQGLSVHSFGEANDKTQSGFLGVLLR
jgi:hypothetical protein